ncbi:MAG: RidA family protein [Pseudolabrys sp.]|jgi:enamine deaminase RidA (YjgF/YER057c/UK114 family)|nr:RidA family protein [Pseudolabrys sp.]
MSKNTFEFLQPKNWMLPKGYSNGVAAEGRQVFIAGQIGWNERCQLVSDDFVGQAERALSNIVAVLAEAGGEPRHLTRLTWFVTDKATYVARQKEIGEAYRRVIGRHFPAMSLIVVAGLLESGAKVEIEGTAVIPAS